jgi:hypothetical protein
MYILIINRKNQSLMRLMNSWNNPGPHHAILPEGTLLEKLGSNAYLFSGTRSSVARARDQQ